MTRIERQGLSLVARRHQKHAYTDGTMELAAEDYVSKIEYCLHQWTHQRLASEALPECKNHSFILLGGHDWAHDDDST